MSKQPTLYDLDRLVAKVATQIECLRLPEGLEWNQYVEDDLDSLIGSLRRLEQSAGGVADDVDRHRRYLKVRAQATEPSRPQTERDAAALLAEKMREGWLR